MFASVPTRTYVLFGALLVALQALALYLFGQPLIAASGIIQLWAGDPLSPGNSQHLTDWYTLSHIVHGFIFYWLLGKFFPRLPLGARLFLAVGIEAGWEVLENTPWLIEHYRQQALAVGYVGDSIINSVSDSLFMLVGFAAARFLPVWASVVAVFGLEALPLYFIRDSLVLNVINLLHQFDFITKWQSDG